MQRVIALDPASYRRHLIHGEGRRWSETNCYVDLWVELLHALGHEPIAALAFTLPIDFEGDQWTFFKFPLSDIYDLYGLDVQELAIWRPVISHVEEQVGRGNPVLVELDSFYLPDTAGTAYKQAHVKTTVAVMEVDVEAHHLGYFHNQGYFHLSGDDFTDIFRLRGEPDPSRLAPYVEFVKTHNRPKASDQDIARVSVQQLRKQLTLLPLSNPFARFRERLVADMDWLLQGNLETFHQYSFATLRQYGACYELSATYLRWLDEHGEKGAGELAERFDHISEGAKVFQFQLARAISRRKPLDMSPLDDMAASWDQVTRVLKSRFL